MTDHILDVAQPEQETDWFDECSKQAGKAFRYWLALEKDEQRFRELGYVDWANELREVMAAQPPAAPVETAPFFECPGCGKDIAETDQPHATDCPRARSSAGNAVPADLIGDIDYAIQCARVFKASTAIDWLESMRRKYTALAATEPQAAPTREDVAFEFYRFSHPNRWDCPRADVRNDFNNCRGSATWDRCIRSADATLALTRPERGTP